MHFIYAQLKTPGEKGHLPVPGTPGFAEAQLPLFITLLIVHSLIPTPFGRPISRLKWRCFGRVQGRKPLRVIVLLLSVFVITNSASLGEIQSLAGYSAITT